MEEHNKIQSLLGSPKANALAFAQQHAPAKFRCLRFGRWYLSEHFRFLYAALMKHGKWNQMQKYVQTRSVPQIRTHSQKYLKKIHQIHSNNNVKIMDEYRSKQ